MIGDDSESGAFVFGIYSFLDKIANGVVLYMITVRLDSLLRHMGLRVQ